MVSVSVRKSRFSHHLINEHREFTVNLPRISDLDAVKYCGLKSGRDRNKFADLRLTPVPCPPLEQAPMIGEFFHALGCRVRHVMELGSHDMFVAEVVSVYVRDEDRRTVRPDPRGAEQIAYLDGKYWRLTKITEVRSGNTDEEIRSVPL